MSWPTTAAVAAVAASPAVANRDPGIVLRVMEVVEETHDTRTIRLDNSGKVVAIHRPGQHIKLGVQDPTGPTWRSFTISSPPTRPDVLEVTVKRNPTGIVSPAIHSLRPGAELLIQGTQGRFIFDLEAHKEPLVMVAAGNGIAPAMSILRTIHDLQLEFRYFAPTTQTIISTQSLPPARPRREGLAIPAQFG